MEAYTLQHNLGLVDPQSSLGRMGTSPLPLYSTILAGPSRPSREALHEQG